MIAQYSRLSNRLLSDYDVIGMVTPDKKLQVVTDPITHEKYLDSSYGSSSTALGWFVQSATRTYDTYFGSGGSDRSSVIEHIESMNSKVLEQFEKIRSALSNDSCNIQVIRQIQEDMKLISVKLRTAVSRIDTLINCYEGDNAAIEGFRSVKTEMEAMSSGNTLGGIQQQLAKKINEVVKVTNMLVGQEQIRIKNIVKKHNL